MRAGVPGRSPWPAVWGTQADRDTCLVVLGTGWGASRAAGAAREGHGQYHLPAPFPAPFQAPSSRRNGAFGGYYACTGSFLAACQLHVCPGSLSSEGSTSPPDRCCPCLLPRRQLPAGAKAAAHWRGPAELAPPSPLAGHGDRLPAQLHAPAGHRHPWCQIRLREDGPSHGLPPGRLSGPFPCPSPHEAPGAGRVGAGSPSGRSAEADRTAGEEAGRGSPAGAGRGKVGTDFGGKYEPCMGLGSGGSRIRPFLTAAPVEGDAGADTQ